MKMRCELYCLFKYNVLNSHNTVTHIKGYLAIVVLAQYFLRIFDRYYNTNKSKFFIAQLNNYLSFKDNHIQVQSTQS